MDFLYNKFGLKYARCEDTTPQNVLRGRGGRGTKKREVTKEKV